MRQTVKFGRTRAAADPDRDNATHGTFYGSNMPGPYTSGAGMRMCTTRGVWLRRGTS